jgi:hypothetical protein
MISIILQYCYNMLFAIDAFVSTILGGEPDDTISERIGRAYLARNTFNFFHWLIITWANNLVNFLLYITAGQRNHCVMSLQGKTGTKELWSWGGTRVPKVM